MKYRFDRFLLVVAVVVFVSGCATTKTDLQLSASKGDIKTVKSLITEGVDVDAKDNEGLTALMSASFKGHIEVVKALLAAGADINAKRYDDVTA